MTRRHFRVPSLSRLPTSRDALLALKVEVDASIAQIDEQLRSARSASVEPDADWYARARRARRIYGLCSQRIQAALTRIKQEKSRAVEGHFVDVARERLLEEFFIEILEEANRRAVQTCEGGPK